MKFQVVIFDLDGTLLDTIEDLSDSMNLVLEKLGHPGHSISLYKNFVGNGIRNLVIRSLPQPSDEALIGRALKMMQREYRRRCFMKTVPYKGIPEVLKTLVSRGVKLAVLSNKPDPLTRKMVNKLLPGKYFEIVMGEKSGVPLKPDPSGACAISAGLKIDPSGILYLGDSSVDILTAKAAGMYPAGALWGFRSREELEKNGALALFKDPYELLQF